MPIKQYEFIEIPVKDIEARIQLPHFQRGLVWTTQKKNDFILTLKEGLPFGSILVYPETSEASSRLLILDGQQRLSTILEYRKNRCPSGSQSIRPAIRVNSISSISCFPII